MAPIFNNSSTTWSKKGIFFLQSYTWRHKYEKNVDNEHGAIMKFFKKLANENVDGGQ
jgi:hypothetical protein